MSATMTGAPPSPQLFFETANAFQRTEALKTAIELELFTAIAEGKQTAEDIGARCKASARGTRILCDFLVVHGLLTKHANRYALTPDSAVFLDKHSKAYVGGALRFLLLPSAVEGYKHLTEAVRKGGTAEEGAKWKVLSLAAGHGLYEVTLARHNRNAEVWAVDWANVLEVAKENAAAAAVAGRYHTIPGSAFDVEYGDGYDIALVVNFLHHFDQLTCEALLRRVQASLKPGGRAVIVEFVPNDDRVTPPLAASFSLIMLAGTPAGEAYTFKELQRMLGNSGFRSSELHPLPPTFFNVVIGTK